MTKETFAAVGKIVSKPEDKETLVEHQVSKEGQDNFQYQAELLRFTWIKQTLILQFV